MMLTWYGILGLVLMGAGFGGALMHAQWLLSERKRPPTGLLAVCVVAMFVGFWAFRIALL